MNEIWKDIIWYEWKYKISNLWEVKSINYNNQRIEKILKRWIGKDWHSQINLCLNWVPLSTNISRLVGINFIPNPNNLPFVLHKDETLDENWALYNWEDNLYWWTHSDNMQDKHRKWRANNLFQNKHPWKWKFWKDHHMSKKVDQYTKDGVFVKTWDSIMDIKRELWIDTSSISACCKKTKLKSSWWYKWEYSKITK